MALADLIERTQKQFKKKNPDSELTFNLAKDEKPPTGLIVDNPLFEYILDRRFLAYGRFYLVYGQRGCAKTSLFYELAKMVQRSGGDVILIETEHALDLDYARKQGVDVDKMVVHHPQTLEEGLNLAELYIRNLPATYPEGTTPVLIGFDSLAGGATEYELDPSHSVSDMMPGTHARLLSKWYREMEGPLASERCIFVANNQLKEKIGGFGYGEDANDSMIGGNAPLFNSTYQFKMMRPSEQYMAKDASGADRKVGSKHQMKCKRNKLGREGKGQEIEIDVWIDGGVDWWGPLVRFLGKNYGGLVHKNGAWYTWQIPNVEYDDESGAKAIINIEDPYREQELAVIIMRSTQAREIIRTAFGIPPLPTEEEVTKVEAERKVKRNKKKAALTDDEPPKRSSLTK